MRIRQGPDQYAVNHAEDRGVRADAKRQRQDDGSGKRGSLSQAAYRVARIAEECFRKRESSLIAIDLLDGFHVAKLQQRLPTGFDGRQAGSKILGRLHGDVFVDFGPQDVFVPGRRRPRGQPLEKPPQCLHFRSRAFTAKNRSMIAVVCSQLRASACNCLRPCRVSR